MKTLSLTQPWAMLVGIGAKRIETRSWSTSYRGPLAIHASKRFPKYARDFTLDPDCYATMQTMGYKARCWTPRIPLGAVVATCNLIACVPMKMGEPEPLGSYSYLLRDNRLELMFGNYANGRWAWILSDVKCFERPIPAKGSLGLWNWDETGS